VSDLFKIMEEVYHKTFLKEDTPAVYGSRYIAKQVTGDDEPDFPYIEDPEGFVTHVPLEQDEIEEAEGDPQMPADAGAEAGANLDTANVPPPEGDTGGIGDTGMDAQGNMPGVEGGVDMGMGAGMPQEEQLTSNQIGRVYELKKIYSRLSSVETFLSRTTDEEMLEIRKLVAQSIDLFELVISNFDQFKEKADEIIVTYYEFLDSVYGSLKTYFSGMTKE